MQQFIWFAGRFHVLLLHLPLGILSLAVLFEVMTRIARFRQLEATLVPLWVAGAISALATAVLGFLHASEESFKGLPAVEAHRWAGVGLCVVACIIAAIRARPLFRRLRGVSIVLMVLLMAVTGHLGGNLTHGDAFLLQYAPAPLRVLAGLPADATPRPKPTDVASADIFLDIVQPALARRCATCHNNSKRSGGLSVSTYETLMKGGEKGAVIKAGDPAHSDLFRRISLLPDAKDFMPKDGKTPLSEPETAAIGWWIEQGAPRSAVVGSLKPAADALRALQAIIGGQGASTAGVAAAGDAGPIDLPDVPAPDESLIARVEADGFVVRSVYQGSHLLEIDYTSPKPLTPEALTQLTRLAPNILRLNLRRSGIGDAQVKQLTAFVHLRQLRLEMNPLGDTAAGDLAKLIELRSLNLSNTRFTDHGVATVARLPGLRNLYIWGTPVTPAAIQRTRSEYKMLSVEGGLRAADIPADGKVIPPDF